MKFLVNHIPKDTPHGRRPGHKMDWETITVHNTGNPKSSALNERDWLVNLQNKRSASFNYAIDENTCIEVIPETESTWHAGDGSEGLGNRTSLSVELCESGNWQKTRSNGIRFIAKKLHEKGKGIECVRTHQSWSGKYCPRKLLPYWTEFLEDIQNELGRLKKSNVSDWAKPAREWVVEKGISDGSRPKETVTREEIWTMLHNYERQEGRDEL